MSTHEPRRLAMESEVFSLAWQACKARQRVGKPRDLELALLAAQQAVGVRLDAGAYADALAWLERVTEE